MTKTLAPVNVSPLIKASRWIFLILGITYGMNKLNILRAYEKTARPKRKEEYRLLHLQKKSLDKENSKVELITLAKEFEVTEFPPGWDTDI